MQRKHINFSLLHVVCVGMFSGRKPRERIDRGKYSGVAIAQKFSNTHASVDVPGEKLFRPKAKVTHRWGRNQCVNLLPKKRTQHEKTNQHRYALFELYLDKNLPHDNHDFDGLKGDGSKHPATEAPDDLLFFQRRRHQESNSHHNHVGCDKHGDDSGGHEPLASRARAPRTGIRERRRVVRFARSAIWEEGRSRRRRETKGRSESFCEVYTGEPFNVGTRCEVVPPLP